MTVQCSHCSTRFTLPDELLGPRGARVRCPSCGGQFEVARERGREPAAPAVVAPVVVTTIARGRVAPAAPATAPAEAPKQGRAPAAEAAPAVPPEPVSPETIAARAALAALGERWLEMAEAWRRGRLFAEAGPALLDAFDEYRRRAGPAADSATFRRVLEERSGIVLPSSAGVPSGVALPPLATPE